MIAVITGASAGIGAALGRELTKRGASVVLVARRRSELEAVARACGPNAFAVVADVSRRDDVRRVVREALARFGHVDVWVNNAGQGITRNPSELTDDDVHAMVQANVMTALYGMQESLPHFRERGRGQVVNVSSMLGRIPYATFRAAYTAAKHFMNALTASIRAEVQATHPDIQFTLVSPGVVRTDFGKNALHGGPDSRSFPESQSPEEVAVVIADAMESRRPDVYTFAGARERVIGYYASLGEDP